MKGRKFVKVTVGDPFSGGGRDHQHAIGCGQDRTTGSHAASGRRENKQQPGDGLCLYFSREFHDGESVGGIGPG